MLRDFARRRRQQTGSLEVESEDFMDDGTPIRLRVQINEEEVSSGNLFFIIFIISSSYKVKTQDINFVNLHRHRAARCLTSQGLGQRCGGTATLLGPSPSLPSSTACAVWWDRTSPSIRFTCFIPITLGESKSLLRHRFVQSRVPMGSFKFVRLWKWIQMRPKKYYSIQSKHCGYINLLIYWLSCPGLSCTDQSHHPPWLDPPAFPECSCGRRKCSHIPESSWRHL